MCDLKHLFPCFRPMTCPARVYGTKLFWGFGACRLRVDEWCRLARDDVAIMFMRNAHLGDPHATATQYVYVDDVMAVWSSIKDHCSAEWGPEKMPKFWPKLRLERGLSTRRPCMDIIPV